MRTLWSQAATEDGQLWLDHPPPAALGRLRSIANEGTVDPEALAGAAWRLLLARHTVEPFPPPLSEQRRAQLQASVAQAARYGHGKDAGHQWLLSAIATLAECLDQGEADTPVPTSLAFFVVILRSEVRRWRRSAKGKPPASNTGPRREPKHAGSALAWWNGELTLRRHQAKPEPEQPRSPPTAGGGRDTSP